MDNFDLDSFLDRYAPDDKKAKVADSAKVQIENGRQALKPKTDVGSNWGAGLRDILNSD